MKSGLGLLTEKRIRLLAPSVRIRGRREKKEDNHYIIFQNLKLNFGLLNHISFVLIKKTSGFLDEIWKFWTQCCAHQTCDAIATLSYRYPAHATYHNTGPPLSGGLDKPKIFLVWPSVYVSDSLAWVHAGEQSNKTHYHNRPSQK